jgi:O-antigen/teichoic acid export membrane protein
MTAAAPPVDRLADRLRTGLAWKGASQLVMQLSRAVVAVVLARLLSPHDYGLAALVLIFSNLVAVFSDLALGAALVQRERLSEDDRSTVFWTGVATGVLFTAVGVAAAGPIAAFFHQPEVKPLFRVFSLSFLVVSLGSTQTALLTRELDFRNLELRTMAGTLAGAAAGIALAALGFGPWAIIGQQLAIVAVSTLLLWTLSPWRPRASFSLASLRGLAGFSGNVLGTRLLFFANRNADNLLIGRFVGAAALGVYSVAYTIMLVPFSQLAGPLQQVLFPALSRMQDDVERMARAWLRANRAVAALSVPALLGLIVVAPDFVDVVLGHRWHRAAIVIRILAWVGLLQSLQRLNSSVLQARDRTGPLLRYSVVVLASSLAAFVIGLPWGIVGISIGYAISSTLVEPYYTWLTVRALEISLRTFLATLAGVLRASLLMTAVVVGVEAAGHAASLPAAARLAAAVAAGVVVYLPLAARCDPELVADLRRAVPRRSSLAVAA